VPSPGEPATVESSPRRVSSALPASVWWRSIGPALFITSLLFAFRIIYLLWLCPYELAEDEAFYWEWSQHLAWSYNTKGPGIAWALWLTTNIFGDTIFGIRIVAATSCALGALAVALTAAMLTRGNRTAAFAAAAGYNLIPAFAASGLLSTIDGPYLACWAWAGAFAVAACIYGRIWGWLGLGAALAIGFLFKYTILLVLLGIAVHIVISYASVSAANRVNGRARLRLHACLCALIFALGLLPVLIWNAQHDWVTVRHLLGHLGLSGYAAGTDAVVSAAKPRWSPLWLGELLAIQWLIIGPVLLAMIASVWRVLKSGRGAGSGLAIGRDNAAAHTSALLLHMAWPILLFYACIALIARPEGNWPMAGFVTLLPLAAGWALFGKPADAEPARSWPGSGYRRFVINAVLIYGVIGGIGMLRLDWVRAGLEGISPKLARVVPIGRLTGNTELAAHVLRLQTALDAERGDSARSFVISQSYGRASQLVFSLPGHPVVYAAQSRLGGRAVQQDYWPSHDLDAAHLRGRDVVIIADGDNAAPWKPYFDSVERIGQLDGAIRAARFGFIARGYKGLPPRKPSGY